MMPLTIRPAELRDAVRLADLAARTFADTFGASNTPEDLQAHLTSAYGPAQQAQEIADPEVRTLLACRGDDLVGYAQVRRKAYPSCVVDAQPVELYRFYLDRAFHGTGAAMPLMQAACDAAQAMGGRHLWLGVWERNPRAVAFYEKCGFAKVGSHDFIVGSDVQTDWVFIKSLSTSNPTGP